MKHESRKKLPRFKKIKKWRWIAFWIDSTFPLKSIQKRWSFPLQMYWEKRLPPIRGFWVAVFKANQITRVSSLENICFFLWKILVTSYPWVEGHFSHSWLLPLLYPKFPTKIHKIVLDTPLHIHQLIGILTHEEYIIFRGVLIISCYDKESGIKSCFGWKIYFCFLCHDNMTGLLSTLYITKMTSPSSDYQYGKIWTCERYQHDQTSNRYGKIIKVGKIWAWGGSHGVIY